MILHQSWWYGFLPFIIITAVPPVLHLFGVFILSARGLFILGRVIELAVLVAAFGLLLVSSILFVHAHLFSTLWVIGFGTLAIYSVTSIFRDGRVYLHLISRIDSL